MFESLEELVEAALDHDAKGFFFVLVASGERPYLKERTETLLGDQLDSMSRPPTIQFNLKSGTAIRFLGAGVIDVMRGLWCNGVYVAPFASATLDRQDYGIIKSRLARTEQRERESQP